MSHNYEQTGILDLKKAIQSYGKLRNTKDAISFLDEASGFLAQVNLFLSSRPHQQTLNPDPRVVEILQNLKTVNALGH